jgi:predicted enzyme related to lactoylglutathione lyase
MITKFSGATIWSENLQNLLPFYRDVLGLKVSSESPDFVMLGEDDPQAMGLALGNHSEVHGRNTDPARHMVSFLSDDVRADWQRLKAAGVEFIEDPTVYGGEVTLATLKDPDGNLVQIWQWQQGG